MPGFTFEKEGFYDKRIGEVLQGSGSGRWGCGKGHLAAAH